MKRKLGLVGVTAILVSVVAMPVFALAASKGGPMGPGVASPRTPQVAGPNVFGANTNILQIPASSFVPLDPGDTTMTHDTMAYSYPSDPGWWWATVTLPAGVNISYLDLYAYDTNASFDVAASLRAYSGGDFWGTSPAYSDVTAVSSTGDTGYGYFFSDPAVSHTVNNDAGYNFGYQYAVVVNIPVTDGSLQFKGVDIWWNRQISPAPADPSFSDVPTTHPFFAEIEALATSGITTGFSDGTFRPSATVTRQAMAAFLARALGLHWEY